mgnify:CR=1 FL=1
MEDKSKTQLINNSDGLQIDTSLIIPLNDGNKSDNCLPKSKASNTFFDIFQKLKDFISDINIQECFDWYSNLDESKKREIACFNNPELIELLHNEIIKLKSEQKDEAISKSQNSYNNTFNGIYPQEQYEKELSEDNLKFIESLELLPEKNDKEITKENENIEKEVNFKSTKINSLKDEANTLIFDFELNKLKEYLHYFSKENSKIKPIIPKLNNNLWYITLPNYTNLLENLSHCQIIACTFILLYFEYYLSCNPFFNKQKGFYQENDLIINELLKNKVDVTIDILNNHNSIFLTEQCLCKYMKNVFGEEQEYKLKRNQVLDSINHILNDLKKNCSKSKTIEEKLKILFDKISFYRLNDLKDEKDIKDIKHLLYLELRHFLRAIYYILAQGINDIYRNIINNTEKLKPVKEQYLKYTKNLLMEKLENIDIVEYGSYFTGLCTEFSDIDILLVYKDEKTEWEFGENLENILNKIKKEKNLQNLSIIPHLKNKNSPPVITISYDVSEEIDLNEINFSYKYLDENINNLKKVNIDITFTNNKRRVEDTKKTLEIIIDLVKKYILLKPVVLYLKIYFITQGMYSNYIGGINSISLICIVRNILVSYEKNNLPEKINTVEKIIIIISEKFGHYQYRFGIDKDGNDYTLKKKEIEEYRLIIKSPVDNEKNVASGSFKSDIIIGKFLLLFQLYRRKKYFSSNSKINSYSNK